MTLGDRIAHCNALGYSIEELEIFERGHQQGRGEAIDECMQILKADHIARSCEDDFVPSVEVRTYRYLFERFKNLKQQNNNLKE